MNDGLKAMIDRLEQNRELTAEEYGELLRFRSKEMASYLAERADAVRKREYANDVWIRGAIALSSYCKNDCYYCGIRRSNRFAKRHRMEEAQVLQCCKLGYAQGCRTFLLQGGEDLYYSPDKVAHLVAAIKKDYPDCAVTLSLGERARSVYQLWHDAGADRYLLRHETADEGHYKKLHPGNLSLLRRKQCLWELKDIGYQVGAGFMVGSPYQTIDNLVQELEFMKMLQPQMVGIGPFIPAMHTPFENERSGNAELTLFLLSMLRLILPRVLLFASPSLESIDRNGRQKAIQAGANVVVQDLSPREAGECYTIYDRKYSRGMTEQRGLELIRQQMAEAGYEVEVARGDYRR